MDGWTLVHNKQPICSFSRYLSSTFIGRCIFCGQKDDLWSHDDHKSGHKSGWKSLWTHLLLCPTPLKISVFRSESRKNAEPYLWNTEMTSRGRSVETQCYKDIWIFSASVPPSGSVSQSVLPYFLYLSSYYFLHWPVSAFVLYFLPFHGLYGFMCPVDPEAVNLVIHNRYQPHLFPTDKKWPIW